MRLTLDLHLHSQASPDGRMTVEEIAAAARARGLHGVAVCDHDVVYTGPTEVDGVLLIPGVEFSTEHGHLLGLFVRQPMVYTTWEETTQAVRRLGGLTVLAHPFQHRKEEGKLVPLVPYLDGMETWNGRANRKNPQANAQAAAFAKDYGLIPTAGSDAHLAQRLATGPSPWRLRTGPSPPFGRRSWTERAGLPGRKAPPSALPGANIPS
ncbi:MAG: PHP domain-containing protein [Evtepia gabavorous]